MIDVSIILSNWILFHGFVTKSYAPSFIPLTASSTEAHAVIRITGRAGFSNLIFFKSSIPSSPFIETEKFMSSKTRSKSFSVIYTIISSGLEAKFGVYPALSSRKPSELLTASSSSQISMRCDIIITDEITKLFRFQGNSRMYF